MKRVGLICVAAGAVFVIASLALLHYAGSVKLWDFTTRLPVVLTLLSVTALALALAGLLKNAWAPSVMATCISFYLLGQFFPDDLHAFYTNGTYSVYKIGFWVGTLATLVMAGGGLVAMLELVRERALAGPTAAGASYIAGVGAAAAASAGGASPAARGAAAATPAPSGGPLFGPNATSTPSPAPMANSAPSPPQAMPPSGWYADPAGQARERYWSGVQWTDEVRS